MTDRQDPNPDQRARAERLRAQVAGLDAGQDPGRPKTPRELTDEAACEAAKQAAQDQRGD